MEQRLIDAKALFELICEKYSQPKWGHAFTEAAYMVATEIENAPVVEAAPVVHGRWIEESGIQICSNCGEEHEWEDYRASYCEDCGCRMDGESNG